MGMLLLVSAMALLINLAVVSPSHLHTLDVQRILNHIFDLAEKETCTQGLFVESVKHLTEGSEQCGDKFFCKVHDILRDTGKMAALVENLKKYNKGRNVMCEKALQGMTSTGYQVELCGLLEDVKFCVRYRNMNSSS